MFEPATARRRLGRRAGSRASLFPAGGERGGESGGFAPVRELPTVGASRSRAPDVWRKMVCLWQKVVQVRRRQDQIWQNPALLRTRWRGARGESSGVFAAFSGPRRSVAREVCDKNGLPIGGAAQDERSQGRSGFQTRPDRSSTCGRGAFASGGRIWTGLEAHPTWRTKLSRRPGKAVLRQLPESPGARYTSLRWCSVPRSCACANHRGRCRLLQPTLPRRPPS
jgi:hypothetical protein